MLHTHILHVKATSQSCGALTPASQYTQNRSSKRQKRINLPDMSSTSLKSAEEALFANYLKLRLFFNSKSATSSTGAKGSTWQILKSSRKTWCRPDADGEAVLGCISRVTALAELCIQPEPQPLPGLTQCLGCPHAPRPTFYLLFHMRRKDAVGHLCKVAHPTLETLRHYH